MAALIDGGRTLACAVVLVALGCGDDPAVAEAPPVGDAGATDASGGIGATAGFPASGGSGGGLGGASDAAASGAAGSAGASTGGSTGSGGSAGCNVGGTGAIACGAGGPCEFPQGVPDPDFVANACDYKDTDPAVDAAVNAAMVKLSGCGALSDCPIVGLPGGNTHEVCQSWFAAVTAELRAQGFCAGQHVVGSTDEIAVSNTCCEGKWYGYHICNYGGPKVVWNPGARRGWWMIKPNYCK
jgi:hypothetical protein